MIESNSFKEANGYFYSVNLLFLSLEINGDHELIREQAAHIYSEKNIYS